MGGIAGFVNIANPAGNGAADLETLIGMCHLLRHRTRGGRELYVQGGVALGADASAVSQDRAIVAALDGEILNAAALREELRALGHPCTSREGAETIARGYEAWGEEVFTRLQGAFAIAVWDARQRVLLLARDRAGVKPMLYARASGKFVFGSEAKAILVHPEVDRHLDVAALDHYLAYLLTPRHGFILRGIRKVLPGHLVRVHDADVVERQYWQLPTAATFKGSDADAVEQLDATLKAAVRRQFAAGGTPATLLSGGLNSSLVTAIAAQVSSSPIKTFTIAFDTADGAHAGQDERGEAGAIAQALGTDHHPLVVQPDAVAVLDRVIAHFDEPFADASAVPTWYLSEHAGAHVPMALSGDGDELFGGCERYLPPNRVATFDRMTGRFGRMLAGVASRALPASVKGGDFLRHVALGDRSRYLDAMTFLRADDRAALLAPDLRRGSDGLDADAMFGQPFDHLGHLPWAAQMMAFDFEVEVPEDGLIKRDRMGLAHGLEWRAPLLDDEVVAFAASLPVSMKIRDGRLKHVLREVASPYLPQAAVDRRKQGFGLSPAPWLRGTVREAFGDVLGSPRARQRGYFDYRFVDRLLQQHLAGTHDRLQPLWQLLVFELWHRQYVDAPAMAA